MRRLVALGVAVVALAGTAAQANATQTPTLAQFNALQKQVKTLQAQVKKLETGIEDTQVGTIGLFICHDAVIADEFQGTWNVIDQIAQATQAGKTYFGPQTSITDLGACPAFKVTRPAVVPPTVAIFSSLITLLSS